MHACKYMYLRSVNVLIATNFRVHWRSVKNQQAKETKKRRKQIPSLFSTRSVPSSLLSAAHNRKKIGELKCFLKNNCRNGKCKYLYVYITLQKQGQRITAHLIWPRFGFCECVSFCFCVFVFVANLSSCEKSARRQT